jgi:hypothetical protein
MCAGIKRYKGVKTRTPAATKRWAPIGREAHRSSSSRLSCGPSSYDKPQGIECAVCIDHTPFPFLSKSIFSTKLSALLYSCSFSFRLSVSLCVECNHFLLPCPKRKIAKKERKIALSEGTVAPANEPSLVTQSKVVYNN